MLYPLCSLSVYGLIFALCHFDLSRQYSRLLISQDMSSIYHSIILPLQVKVSLFLQLLYYILIRF